MSETPNKIEFKMLDHERLENDFFSTKNFLFFGIIDNLTEVLIA